MAMLSAMFSGVSGLSSHGKALSSVADNIANINTTAYKATRVNFGDIMVRSLTVGGTVDSAVGSGSRVMDIQNLTTQGSFESTDIPTDLAINGSGFFLVSDPVNASGTTAQDAGNYFTRAGQFLLDKEGYMVNPQGYRLTGFNVDSSGNLLLVPESLRIVTQQADAIATTGVDLSVNLDAEDTKSNHPSLAIDPTSESSYNYLTTSRVYDSLGISHDLALFFQQIDSYDGTTAATASSFWKVSCFENIDGTYTSNPTYPDNTFYMQFDTDGQLVATSTGQPAYGDMYTSSGTVTAGSSSVSDRLGEVLTYTGAAAAGAQTIRTSATVAFAGAASSGDTVTIGTDTYTFPAGHASAAESAAWLAGQINSASVNYYALDDGAGNLTLYSESTGAFETSSSGTNITVTDTTSLNSMVSLIDSGRAATGSLNLSAVPAAGWSITIGGTTFTEGVDFANGASAALTATALAAAVNADANFTSSATGDNVYITYASVGTAGNLAFSTTGGASVTLSASSLLNGVDDSATTLVDASAVASGSAYALRLARTDTGTSATITLASTNTLGDNLGVNFDSWTQDQYAAAAQSTSSIETDGERTLQYDFPNATANQDIEFDFTPTASSASTQSAGDSETFYLSQNGSPRGTLQTMNISDTGLITGQFSNGALRTLGAVIVTNVANPNELVRQGDNLWAWSLDAGDPLPATRPGSGGLGLLESGALEQSNVDLADQFVKMINYQRGFQANTRTISTTDSMLAELINLKR